MREKQVKISSSKIQEKPSQWLDVKVTVRGSQKLKIHRHIFPIFFSPFECSPFRAFFNHSSTLLLIVVSYLVHRRPSGKKYTVLNLPAIKQCFWETEPCWRLSHADGAAADSVKFEPKKLVWQKNLKNKCVHLPRSEVSCLKSLGNRPPDFKFR